MFFKELRYLGCCSDDRKDSIQRFSHEWKQKKIHGQQKVTNFYL